jgi:RNA polymerase sigma-70 factor (ECF subfamily)
MIGSMKNRQAVAGERSQAETEARAFETVFAEYWGHVFRVLYRLVGDPAEAEDLALETFVRLYQRYPSPAHDFNLGGWLQRVATNLGLQALRSRRRRERYELAAGKGALDEAPDDGPVQLLDQAEQHRLARLALGRMGSRQAQLLTLRHSGFSYRQIAAALGLSPASIGPLLLRAEREFEKTYRALEMED